MERNLIAPRPDWQAKMEALGFDWHSPGRPYWDESVYYRFTNVEAEIIRSAGTEAAAMLLDTIDDIIRTGSLPIFGYDEAVSNLMTASWSRQQTDPTLYGRFSMAFNNGQPQVISYDGDFPFGVYETSMAQKAWLQEVMPNQVQFNRLHEGIVAAFRQAGALARSKGMSGIDIALEPSIFGAQGLAGYLEAAANEAMASGRVLGLEQIGLRDEYVDGETDATYFVNTLLNTPINTLVHLCPLPWMFDGDFGDALIGDLINDRLKLMEPAWKALATNKKVLAFMWERYPYHPLLLESKLNQAELSVAPFGYVAKPVNGQQGANITAYQNGASIDQTNGDFGEDDYLYQQLANVDQFTTGAGDVAFAIVQVWASSLRQSPNAISVRENNTIICDETARFVPHIVSDVPV